MAHTLVAQGKCFSCDRSPSAIAGEYSFVGLAFPAGSAGVLYIEAIIISSTVSTFWTNNAADLRSKFWTEVHTTNHYLGQAAGQAVAGHFHDAAAWGGLLHVDGITRLPNGHYQFRHPILVPPGCGVVLRGINENQAVDVALMMTEL